MKFMVKNVIIPIILNYDTEQIYSIDIAYRYIYIYIYIYIYMYIAFVNLFLSGHVAKWLATCAWKPKVPI